MAEVEAHHHKNSRLRISTDALSRAKGGARTVVELLNLAATITQSVPYLGAISTALSEFIKIQDEVDVCRDECREAMDDARQIQVLIGRFRDECASTGKGDGIFSEQLQEAFRTLEATILEIVTVLIDCRLDSPTWKGRLRLYTRRSDLTRQVRDCSGKMGKALQLFKTSLQIHQLLMLDDIRDAVHDNARSLLVQRVDILSSPVTATLPRAAPPLSLWQRATAQLPAPPAIFLGRDQEVGSIVRSLTHDAPARIAVLGPGGIGKTSITLATLHHPEVVIRYDTCRCFLSCESLSTAGDVWRELARIFGVDIDGEGPLSGRLLSELRPLEGIICLDNFEIPWETDTAKVESLLVELASLPKIALMITSRLKDTPIIRWSYPPLKPIAPLPMDIALEIWDTICHTHDDFARRLCEAVDCMPLAVTLLARLARGEATEAIWSRWKTEKIKFIHSYGVEHRLNNLGKSIELSLRMLGHRDAIDLLRLLSIFPKGLPSRHIPLWERAFKNRLHVRDAIFHLKQHSLIQHEESTARAQPGSETNSVLRILSPIRHYMLDHHPLGVQDRLFLHLADVFCDLDGRRFPHNLDNAIIYLQMGLTHGATRERCLRTIACSHQSTCHLFYPRELLLLALKTAREHASPTEGPISLRLAIMWRRQHRYKRALAMIHAAIRCDLVARDISDEIIHYAELAWSNVDAAKHATDLHTTTYLAEAQYSLEVLEKLLGSSPGLKTVDTNALHRAIAGRRRHVGQLSAVRMLDPRAMGPYSMEPTAGANSARMPILGLSC